MEFDGQLVRGNAPNWRKALGLPRSRTHTQSALKHTSNVASELEASGDLWSLAMLSREVSGTEDHHADNLTARFGLISAHAYRCLVAGCPEKFEILEEAENHFPRCPKMPPQGFEATNQSSKKRPPRHDKARRRITKAAKSCVRPLLTLVPCQETSFLNTLKQIREKVRHRQIVSKLSGHEIGASNSSENLVLVSKVLEMDGTPNPAELGEGSLPYELDSPIPLELSQCLQLGNASSNYSRNPLSYSSLSTNSSNLVAEAIQDPSQVLSRTGGPISEALFAPMLAPQRTGSLLDSTTTSLSQTRQALTPVPSSCGTGGHVPGYSIGNYIVSSVPMDPTPPFLKPKTHQRRQWQNFQGHPQGLTSHIATQLPVPVSRLFGDPQLNRPTEPLESDRDPQCLSGYPSDALLGRAERASCSRSSLVTTNTGSLRNDEQYLRSGQPAKTQESESEGSCVSPLTPTRKDRGSIDSVSTLSSLSDSTFSDPARTSQALPLTKVLDSLDGSIHTLTPLNKTSHTIPAYVGAYRNPPLVPNGFRAEVALSTDQRSKCQTSLSMQNMPVDPASWESCLLHNESSGNSWGMPDSSLCVANPVHTQSLPAFGPRHQEQMKQKTALKINTSVDQFLKLTPSTRKAPRPPIKAPALTSACTSTPSSMTFGGSSTTTPLSDLYSSNSSSVFYTSASGSTSTPDTLPNLPFGRIACSVKGCDAIYQGQWAPTSYRRHSREKHSEEGKKFQCKVCWKIIARKDNCRKHLIDIHKMENGKDLLSFIIDVPDP